MNKMTKICFSVLLAGSLLTPVLANATTSENMRGMQKSYTAATKADDAAALKTALSTFREHVEHAKTQVPPDFAKQPADGPDRKAYVEGLDKILQKVDSAQALADAGKLSEAKAVLAEINTLKGEYHSKLRG
ncbi:cytochrome b562 [Pectobacterium brasiliense]|uniref:cytochrome b562 n=1 Tax=Pectobacterium brasiliense TaxID=180957 RepID=UPI00227C1211|nr:cytochrome b562 [Pectobacterium brasiliense]WGL26015.1 cytochrome b562 [Pectobacterium brasiliense]